MKTSVALIVAALSLTLASTQAGDPKQIYSKDCAKCHGADGKGQTKMGQKMGVKDYTDAKVQAALKDDAMTKVIKEGAKDKDGRTLMKPAEGYSDEEIKGLVALIRSFKK